MGAMTSLGLKTRSPSVPVLLTGDEKIHPNWHLSTLLNIFTPLKTVDMLMMDMLMMDMLMMDMAMAKLMIMSTRNVAFG